MKNKIKKVQCLKPNLDLTLVSHSALSIIGGGFNEQEAAKDLDEWHSRMAFAINKRYALADALLKEKVAYVRRFARSFVQIKAQEYPKDYAKKIA